MKQQSEKRWLHGLTLVELLVSLVIGMVVVLAATRLFSGNLISARATQASSAIQDGARVGFDVLTKQIRQAGFHPVASRMNFNSGLANCGAGPFDVTQAICGLNDVGPIGAADEVRVRYWGADGTTPGVADGSTIDCEGLAVPAAQIVEQRFRIVMLPTNPTDLATNTPTLVCDVIRGAANIAAGAPVAAQVPLIYGVDTLQILYGEDTNGDRNVDRWGPASGVVNMGNVLALQIALVIRSDAGTVQNSAYTYNLFGGAYPAVGDGGARFVDPQDRRARRVVSFSVELRNRTS